MTSEVEEDTSPKKQEIKYSEKLVDRVANHLASGLTLKDISELPWSPHYNTLLRWQAKRSYAREKWLDARIIDAPIRLFDKLQELKKVDLEAIASRCAKKEDLSPSMREKLMMAMINHNYKERELVIRELEAYDPDRWGKKGTQIDVNLNFKKEIEMKSLPELLEEARKLGLEYKPAIDGEFEVVDKEQD